VNEDAKRAIFARRARFVAAALAGVAVAACSDGGTGTPQPCLEPQLDAGDDGDAEPQVCLAPPLEDSSTPDASDASTDTGADAEPADAAESD
jgi:hypothetical protein